MESLIRFLVFAATGLLLLAANYWYITRLIGMVIGVGAPRVIAPLQVIGKGDDGGKLGNALASMLKARLGRIREEMKSSQRSLEEAKTSGSSQAPTMLQVSQRPLEPIELPNNIFKPLDLTMSVAGVELGGVLSWIQRWTSEEQTLLFTIHYQGEKATVAGNLDAYGAQTLWVETAGANDDELVGDIAYAITQSRFAKQYPQVAALTTKEFQTLLTSLHQAAEIDKQAALGRVTGKVYDELLTKVEDIVSKMPKWRSLTRLAAQLAERAESFDKAIDFYEAELALSDKDTSPQQRQATEGRIAELKKKLEQKLVTVTALKPAVGAAGTRVLSGPVFDELRRLVGVNDLQMTRQPIIAIVGPPPLDGILTPEQLDIVQLPEKATSAVTEDGLVEYVSAMVQAILLTAPSAKFMFIPVSVNSGVDIAVGVNHLLTAKKDMDMLFLPYRGTEALKPVFEAIVQKLKIVVVISAGNDPDKPVPFANTALEDQLVIVSAVSRKGSKAPYTASNDKVIWAPGEQIPYLLSEAKKVRSMDGTGPASAIAAGVIARILAQYPKLDPAHLVRILRITSKSIGGKEQVLNLAAALEKLSAQS
jgi:hypothetical protein